MTVQIKLERLADTLLNAACENALADEGGEELTTKEKVEIFKAVTAWYLGERKSRKPDPDDTDSGGTFADLQRKINGKTVTQ